MSVTKRACKLGSYMSVGAQRRWRVTEKKKSRVVSTTTRRAHVRLQAIAQTAVQLDRRTENRRYGDNIVSTLPVYQAVTPTYHDERREHNNDGDVEKPVFDDLERERCVSVRKGVT